MEQVSEDLIRSVIERNRSANRAPSNAEIAAVIERNREAERKAGGPSQTRENLNALAQGTVGLGAGAAFAVGNIGQEAQDAALGFGSAITPRASRRGGGLNTSAGGRIDPLSRGTVPMASITDAPTERTVEAGPVPQLWSNDAPTARAAAQIAHSMRQWGAERFPRTAGDSFLSDVAENTFQGLPSLAGGVAVGTGATVATGNPAAGVTAGAAFMALTDAGSTMEETYRAGLEQGMTEQEASGTANRVGATYAAASIMLERVGLGKILGPADGLATNTIRQRMLQAARRTASAGTTEGVTEVAQGVAQRGIDAWAREDWQGFTEAYTASDEPLQEFLAGALLGGGVRAGGEVLNPSNYRSRVAFLADAKAVADQADAQETTAPNAQDEPARGGSGLVTVDPGQSSPILAEPSVNAEAAGQGLLEANGVPGRVLGETDLNDEQRAVTERFSQRGIQTVFVDGGQPLGRAASNPAPGVVVIDAQASGDQAAQALAWHEAVHDLERRDPGVWSMLESELEEFAPGLMQRSRAEYAARWRAQTGQEIDEARLRSEGPSGVAERVITAIMAEDAEPGLLGRVIRTAPPGVRDRLVSAIQALMRRFNLFTGATRLETIRETLARGEEIGGQDAASAAVLIRDAVRQLRPFVGTDLDAVTESGRVVHRGSGTQEGRSGVENRSERTNPGEPIGTGTVAEIRTPSTRPGRGSEFRNRAIRRRLREIATEIGFEDERGGGAVTLTDDEQAAIGTDELGFSFPGPIPQEIQTALEGRPANVRLLFSGNQPRGTGEDAMAAIGADELVRRAEQFAGRGEAGIDSFLDERGEGAAPDVGMLRAVQQLREGERVADLRPFEVLENAGNLPAGATFEIQGQRFVVYEGEGGAMRATDDRGEFDFNLSGVEGVPIDRRSLKRNAQAELPVLDLPPFALAPPTDSPEFRRWFGDSKIVDENGDPRVMYHGTKGVFSTFDAARNGASDEGLAGPGFYFTYNAEEAVGYALNEQFGSGTRPSVLPVYLAIENPFVITNGILPDGRSLREAHGGGINFQAGVAMRTQAEQGGHDGVVFVGADGLPGHAVAWKPEQIKSATGNRGTFDPQNSDIRFALNPQEDLPNARAVERITPEGRPDLANPGRTEETRALVNEIDQLRNAAGQPEPTTFDAIEARAQEMMGRDFDGAVFRAKEKVQRGDALTAEETVILAEATNRQAQSALRTENAAELGDAVKTAWQYRQSGTIAARALGIRRDRVAGPKQRLRDAMMDAVLIPPPPVRRRLARIAEEMASDSTPPSKRKDLEEEQRSLFEQEGARVGAIRSGLAERGIDPRLITEDTMADPTWAATVAKAVQSSKTNIFDRLFEFRLMSILSSPRTHFANLGGNAAMVGINYGPYRLIESALGSMTGGRLGDATLKEYAYLWTRAYDALGTAFKYASQSWRENRQVFDQQVLGREAEDNLWLQVKGERIPVGGSNYSNPILKLMEAASFKSLNTGDQFFKSFMAVQEANGLAYRIAKEEGLSGDAVSLRVDELLEDPTSDIWKEGLEVGREATFQDPPGPITEIVLKFRNEIPGVRWFLPFVMTPARILYRGVNLTTAGALPLTVRTGATVAGAFSGRDFGGYQKRPRRFAKDMAQAMISVGLLAAVHAMMDDDEDRPRITGTRAMDYRDLPEQYRTAPPMSFRIGDAWYSYNRIEPLSTGIALSVDLLRAREETQDWAQALGRSWKSLARVLAEKSYLQSFGDFAKAFDEMDRAGNLIPDLLRRNFVTPWVPNILRDIPRGLDSSLRDRRMPKDTPFWTRQLALAKYELYPLEAWAPPPKHDLWGRPIEKQSPVDSGVGAFLWRAGVPIPSSRADLHPMDILIANYNERVRQGEIERTDVDGTSETTGEYHPKPVSNNFRWNGLDYVLEPEEYQDLMRDLGTRVSDRLLGMSLDVDNPGPNDIARIESVFKSEHRRAKARAVREGQARLDTKSRTNRVKLGQ